MDEPAAAFARPGLVDRLFHPAVGRESAGYRLRALSDAEKPPILQAYLDRFRREVQRLFRSGPGRRARRSSRSPRYPAFELLPKSP